MIIEPSPEIEGRLKAKANSEGVSIGTYVERLVFEEEARYIRLAEFEQTIGERLKSLRGRRPPRDPRPHRQ
jgi:hypothetical protein